METSHMTTLAQKLQMFFESDCKKIEDVDKLIEHNAAQQAWLDALMLYRKGVHALQKNDLSGVENIKAANDALKKIAKLAAQKEPETALKALSESVEKVKAETISENIVDIKLQFAELYKQAKVLGFSEIMNESNFYEEDETGEDQVDENCGKIKEEASEEVVANEIADAKTDTPEEKHIFEKGFEEGRAAWKHGDALNERLNTIVEQNHGQTAHSDVLKYQEGFKEGWKFQEKLARHKTPELFENEESK